MTTASRSVYHRFKVWFNPVRRKQLSVFLICLCISFVLWLLTKMSENVSSSLEYPVQIQDIPEGMTLTSQSDSIFNIRVDSRGWHMLTLRRMQNSGDVPVSLRNIRLSQSGDQYYAALPTSGIEEKITHEMEVYNNMVSLSPDTLYLTFEKQISKEIPVVPQYEYTPDDQFFLYDEIAFSPQSITVTGASSDLESIDTLYTERWGADNLRGRQVVPLKILSPQSKYPITIGCDSVSLVIPLEQYTEAVVNLPINAINTINSKEIKVFPNMAEIRYLVALKDYNNINRHDFRVEAQYNESLTTKIPLNIVYYPKKCKIRSIEPESVEFIFIK